MPLQDPTIQVLIVNTNVKHELTGGEYAQRRAQCEAAARHLGVPALRDATPELLEQHRPQLDPLLYRRARHVITENERTTAAARALTAGEWDRVGQLMYQSHASLRDDYEVSCPELDLLVELTRQQGAARRRDRLADDRRRLRRLHGQPGPRGRPSRRGVDDPPAVSSADRHPTVVVYHASRPGRSNCPGSRSMSEQLKDFPHRRYNMLTGEWVLVSPHRTLRPWQGQREHHAGEQRPAHDPGCYLCPGNSRAGGHQNPPYASTFVFTNDFPGLLPDSPLQDDDGDPLFRSQSVQGTCRVICFSPRHDLTLPEMSPAEIRAVVDLWADQVTELSRTYRWVQVFENKGAIQGCSNPHPHGQIWAASFLPNEPAKEERQQADYFGQHDSVLLVDYVQRELALQQRVVVEEEHWVVVVPYWATWPFETLLLPRRRQILRLPDLTDEERDNLAVTLKRFLIRYDNLFETSFPYSMGWHGAPSRTRPVRPLAIARPLLSAPAAFGHGQEVHGRIRNAGRTAA